MLRNAEVSAICIVLCFFCESAIYMLRSNFCLYDTYQLSLGGIKEYSMKKRAAREAANLPGVSEDTVEVTRNLRASSPPASAGDILDVSRRPPRQNRRVRIVKHRGENFILKI